MRLDFSLTVIFWQKTDTRPCQHRQLQGLQIVGRIARMMMDDDLLPVGAHQVPVLMPSVDDIATVSSWDRSSGLEGAPCRRNYSGLASEKLDVEPGCLTHSVPLPLKSPRTRRAMSLPSSTRFIARLVTRRSGVSSGFSAR